MRSCLSASSRPKKALLGGLAVFLWLAIATTAHTAEVVTSTVGVGRTPVSLAVNPVSHQVYVTNFFGNSVSVIDGASETLTATVTMPSYFSVPNAVVVDALATPARAFVANYWSRSIAVVDEGSMSVTGVISGLGAHASGPRALALDPTSSPPKLYVASYGSGEITVVDIDTNTVIEQIQVGGTPRALAISASAGKRRIYAAVDRTNRVAVIDGSTDTLVGLLPTGSRPKAVAVDPDRGYAYVTNEGANTVTVVDDTDNVAATVAVGGRPIGVAVDSAGGLGYVANYNSASVSVIDLTSNTVTATVAVGTRPYAVSFDPASGNAYVTDYGSNQVSIIGPALTSSELSVGSGPFAVVNDGGLNPAKTFVANAGSNSVSVISETAAAPVAMLALQPAYAAPARPAAIAEVSSVTPMGEGLLEVEGRAEDIRSPYASGILAVFWRLEGESTWRRAEIVEGVRTTVAQWRAVVPSSGERLQVAVVDEASAVSASSYSSGGTAGVGLAGVCTLELAGDTEPPSISDIGVEPDPVRAGATAVVSAKVDDTESGGSLVDGAEYALGGSDDWRPMSAADGSFDEPVEDVLAEAVFPSAGMVTVDVRGTDAAGNVGEGSPIVVPVYDPEAGRLTAGGWVADDTEERGRKRLTFGVTARYSKNETLQGQLQAVLPDGRALHSTSLEWMVVDRDLAVLYGEGRLDGAPCRFMFSTLDGEGEGGRAVRLTVRALDDTLIHDNGENEQWWIPDAELGGGSVKIHR